VLTPDFVYVMGKKEGAHFKLFTDYCVKAYLIVRRNASFLFTLFSMVRVVVVIGMARSCKYITVLQKMLNTGLEELDNVEALEYLKSSLSLHRSESEASEEFKSLINYSLKLGWSTQINWW
jgi:phosphatidylinositol-4,5-bisphosphate 3-kinase